MHSCDEMNRLVQYHCGQVSLSERFVSESTQQFTALVVLHSVVALCLTIGKGKGKVHPRTGHDEVLEG
jgi:hypothetical protein